MGYYRTHARGPGHFTAANYVRDLRPLWEIFHKDDSAPGTAPEYNARSAKVRAIWCLPLQPRALSDQLGWKWPASCRPGGPVLYANGHRPGPPHGQVRQGTVGLVGLHIVQKTASRPQWLPEKKALSIDSLKPESPEFSAPTTPE
jgi:hypothetical protein